jgi:peptide/nickel transport system ATP-binding protein
MSNALLRVRNLKKHFDMTQGFFSRSRGVVRAVEDVSFDIMRGETFGLVGESGCGKTTIGRTILRALEPTDGQILLTLGEGQEMDLATMNRRDLRTVRKEVQMIFQDPYSSLSPRMTVKEIISEPAKISGLYNAAELDELVEQLLVDVGLKPQHLTRYPHAFSGGQRQRIGIARALTVRPSFIVADEPVSSLDVSVQAQILELMIGLKEEFNLSYLFISHDLSVVRYICDRVGVMYVGRLMELTDTETLFEEPKHPYTAALLSAIPSLDPTKRDATEILPGEVADPASPPSGCYFHPRCKHARDICGSQRPELKNTSRSDEPEHLVACHFAGELSLR